MAFQLTAGQETGIKELSNWWSGGEQFVIVSGEGGTGKTFLTKHFLNSLPKAVPRMTATSNEAVRQMELALGTGSEVCTTYRALGLALSTRSFKQTIYQKRLPHDFYDYNMLVVDEVSMADKMGESGKEELLDFLIASGIRCILLGDWAQLPPPSSDSVNAPAFEQGWKQIELTENKRHDGDILRFCQQIRAELTKPLKNLREVPEGINQIKRAEAFNFSSDAFSKIVADKARIITWTNRASRACPVPGVEEYNTVIRNRLFGEKVARVQAVVPTDKLLFASPLMQAEEHEFLTEQNFLEQEYKTLATVNTRGEVLRTEPTTLLGFAVLRTEVELESGKVVQCFIPTREGAEQKGKFEKMLADKAAALPKGQLAGEAWHYYHTFRGCFADVKHTYCITTHRSQGATIDEVFLDVGNILQNRDRLVAFKSLYVGASRAREKLNLITVR